jgi:signal transduction histidine kinase
LNAGTSVDALWLATLNQIAGRAAHELKGALNGVAVNIEVVRSRAEKPDAAASAVRMFANAAAEQLDSVIVMSEALLLLSRPGRSPVDVGRLVRSMGSLLIPAARADGRELQIEGTLEDVGSTSADANVARAVVGCALLAAVDAASRVVVRDASSDRRSSESGSGVGALRIELAEGASAAPALGADIIAAADAEGIRIAAEPSAIFISFPR